MTEPLSFDDDLHDDVLTAFAGLVQALHWIERQGESVLVGLGSSELDEARFRFIELVTAALDTAGVDDAFDRLEALNLMIETLRDHLGEVITDREHEDALKEDRGPSSLWGLWAALIGPDSATTGSRARPLTWPHLRAGLPSGSSWRN